MTNIAEFFGEKLDPIEDVRRCFEGFYTDNYYNPLNGDWISDDYLDIIDLTTQPRKLSEREEGKLNRRIERFNEKYAHIQTVLGESGLAGAYINVIEQINAINLADPNREGIVVMETSQIEVIA